MSEKVSIIVPIYNVERYLRRCLDSIAEQTYKNIEVLLVDDCSTDHSADIARVYTEKYPEYFHFIQREKNGGLSAARNSGIQRATGEWLTFIDSDDWVTKDYVEILYGTARRDMTDIVANDSRYLYYEKKGMRIDDSSGNITTDSSHGKKIAGIRFSATSRLIKKALLQQSRILFPEDIWRCEDISVMVPLYTMTDQISVIHTPTYYYFQRNNSLSNQNQRNVDLSFYPKTIRRMYELSKDGFEKELEFHAISELLYGMVMIILRSQRTKKEFCEHVNWFLKTYPDWKRNPYLSVLPIEKRIFIYFASKKNYGILKMLIGGWDLKNGTIKRQ